MKTEFLPMHALHSVIKLYSTVGIFHKLYQFEVTKITHFVCTKHFPHNLSQYYEKYGSSHFYSTRRSSSLMLAMPQEKTSKLQFFFWYQSIKIWKFISISIKLSLCFKFKILYKNFLLYGYLIVLSFYLLID